MSLTRLDIQQFRNLERVALRPSSGVNLIYGANGSGKTSVLEAIHALAVGRSFRTHRHRPLIQWEKDAYTLYAEVDQAGASIPLGLQRRRNGEVTLKANGRAVGSLAELATLLPVQVIDAHSFALLEGSPRGRRQFMDWLVFHVEPSFFAAWKGAQRCLRQRNSLLRRDRMDGSELAIWDRELVRLSEEIDDCRRRCIEKFQPAFMGLLEEFVAIPGVSLSYQRGWDRQKPYEQVLTDNFERDRLQGHTQSGSHRADLRIMVKGQPAGEVLSRGQQKLVICALRVAQGLIFSRSTGYPCLYLVDDLPSELDDRHRAKLVEWLDRLKTQVFVTGVDREALKADWMTRNETPVRLFHVEQGRVSEQTEQQTQ